MKVFADKLGYEEKKVLVKNVNEFNKVLRIN